MARSERACIIVNGDLVCSPSHIPSLAPTSALGTRHPSLEMRLDGSIDLWLPADTMKLKRRVGAVLGVQNVDNMDVQPRAGSIVVTILEGAYPCQVQLSGHGWRKMGLLLQCNL